MLPALQPISTPSNPFSSSFSPISFMKRFWVGTWPPQRTIQSAFFTSRAAFGAFRRSSMMIPEGSIPEFLMQSDMPFRTESVKARSSGAALMSRISGFSGRFSFIRARKLLSVVKWSSPYLVGLPVRKIVINGCKFTIFQKIYCKQEKLHYLCSVLIN